MNRYRPSNTSKPQGPKSPRKIGRYVLLVLLIGISAPWWTSLFPSKGSEKSESSSSSAKGKSSSLKVSSSAKSSSSSSLAESSSGEQVFWLEKKSAGILNLAREFSQNDTAFGGHPAVHPAFVAHALEQARTPCAGQKISMKLSLQSSAPNQELAYQLNCGTWQKSYQLRGKPEYALWTDSSGCRRGMPCFRKIMADYIPQEQIPGGAFIRYMPGVSSAVLAPEKMRVLDLKNQGGAYQLLLGWGFSWKVEIRGLLSTPLKKGQVVEALARIGDSRAALPLEISYYYQGQPVSIARLNQMLFPAVAQ